MEKNSSSSKILELSNIFIKKYKKYKIELKYNNIN
jgi:hypothetical protein